MENQDVDREEKLARLLEAFDERLASSQFLPGDWEPLPDDLDEEVAKRQERDTLLRRAKARAPLPRPIDEDERVALGRYAGHRRMDHPPGGRKGDRQHVVLRLQVKAAEAALGGPHEHVRRHA